MVSSTSTVDERRDVDGRLQLADSPSRMGRLRILACGLDLPPYLRHVDLGILNKQLSWDEARFIRRGKSPILPVKWLKATTAGIATKMPSRRDQGLGDAARDHSHPADPRPRCSGKH
jgi:hypothetical protein